NGIGLYSYFVCGAKAYPDERLSFLSIGLWWFLYWSLRRLWINFKHPTYLPTDLIWAELKGSLTGLSRYQEACRNADDIISRFGALTPEKVKARKSRPRKAECKIAVHEVDLSQPILSLDDLTDYSTVRLFVTWADQLIGSVDIENDYQPVNSSRLVEAIVDHLGLKILDPAHQLSQEVLWAEVASTIAQRYAVQESITPQRLSSDVTVSINLATYDRPEDLRNCLRCLTAQDSPRKVEIIVVDNNPSSGLTPPVVAEFPDVILVSEPRQGLAYARNTGFVVSTGDVVIATDDDVTLPSDWLEKLVAPFARPDVMIVTGHVLPIELETRSQQSFEEYGGLGRGFKSFEVNGDWFEAFPRTAAPTWRLGATANAAFRASIFHHPKIGLMEEALGPGMPSGVGEDTYLFYKVLKAGYTLVYEPSAYVWHKHRQEPSALRRQIYGYSKGHVSYNLTTWLKDGDWRGLFQVLVGLPVYHGHQIKNWLLRRGNYPFSLILLEIKGNLAGPWSLWRSHQRVKREGRSNPYVPVSQRSARTLEVAPPASMQVEISHNISAVTNFSAQGANAHAG
ncbi:MAG TPA: glycosyltransferase, partial [Candidatus Obscuribacterales bacterium]